MPPTALGSRLRLLRKRQRLTLAQVGELVGVSLGVVNHWEQGRTQVPSELVPAIARALGVTICEFYGVEEGHAQADRPGRRWARRLAEGVAEMSPADQEFVRQLADVLEAYRQRLRAEEGVPAPSAP